MKLISADWRTQFTSNGTHAFVTSSTILKRNWQQDSILCSPFVGFLVGNEDGVRKKHCSSYIVCSEFMDLQEN